MIKKFTTFLPLLLLSSFLSAANFPDISVEDLQKAISAKEVAVIDVNGPNSYSKGHIPGAIEFSSQKETLKTLLPKDKNTLVVAYCGGPSCRAYLRGAKSQVIRCPKSNFHPSCKYFYGFITDKVAPH